MKSTRRQVGGIIQIIVGAISTLISLMAFLEAGAAMQHYEAFIVLLFSAMILGIGIYYVRTFRQRPVKKIEYTLGAILVVLIILSDFGSNDFTLADSIIFIDAIAFAIGAPTKKGYKYMPFADKQMQKIKTTKVSTGMICALCKKKTNNYLRFLGNKVVCIDCGKKYGMVRDNKFTPLAKSYADLHTVGALEKMLNKYGFFEKIEDEEPSGESDNLALKKNQANKTTNSSDNQLTCVLCGKSFSKDENYYTFLVNNYVGPSCALKYGLVRNDKLAREYGKSHTIGELKRMFKEYGEFSDKQAKIDLQQSMDEDIERKTTHLRRTQHENFDDSPQHPKEKHSFFYYVGIVAVALFCLNFVIGFVRGCSNSMNDDSEPSSSSTSKPRPLSPKEKAKINWNHKKIVFSDGTFKIKKIAKIKAYTFGSDLVPGLLLVGNYTNKTDEAESVTDFLTDHTNVSNIGKKSESDMDAMAYRESSPEYRQLFRNADDKTKPNKTVECAVHYITDHGMDEDIPNNFRFQITKTNGDVLYTVNLKNLPIVRTNISMSDIK